MKGELHEGRGEVHDGWQYFAVWPEPLEGEKELSCIAFKIICHFTIIKIQGNRVFNYS